MTNRRGFAVLGYAVRFPGAADADAFWGVLTGERHAVSEVPQDRWDVDEFYDPDPDTPGKMVSRQAGFIDDVAGFDAAFFGVSAREAMYMDPQHRLMLELAWSSLEHAGIAPLSLTGTPTGVFMGLSTHEFLGMLVRLRSAEDIDIYSGTGTSPAAGAGRISFRLGLQGPSVVVDTACSSSLVAVHQACQALDAGDCDLALVGGVNVILTPVPMINFSRARMLAPDGRCKTFDAAADGYVRGEGCGVVVLKRVGDAIRDGDPIRAVIRGSAVNQDGASGGLTVPNGGAQQQVIGAALRRAGVGGDEVDYLEAHGTGTSLGDPIEVQAAGAVFGERRDPQRPLLIGSVKTNIGHLEAASGIAGLIKVVLSLEHGLLPKHLHFQQPSPHIPWDRLPVRVVDQAMPWQRSGRPRMAGISSFGFSGTNAHVVVEEAPATDHVAAAAPDPCHDRFRVLPLSARTPEALTALASRYRDWMDANPDAALADICGTAGAARSHFEHRAALVVNSRGRARRLLKAVAEDSPAPGLIRGVSGDRPKTAWLFTGQGSQFPGMAKGLFDTEPVFADVVTQCAGALDGVLARPLLDVLFDTGPDSEQTLRDTAFAQPALFATEMALARLWQSWGVEPDVVLGHSVGQYAAACVAGILDLEDGARLMAERGRLFSRLPAGGRMVAVFADAVDVEQCATDHPRLSVAAYNGANTVLSGPADQLEQAVAEFSGTGVRCEWLETSHAFHSALLDPVLDEFESYARSFDYSPPQLTLICNRTGEVLTPRTKIDGRYWRRHARQPVRFADGVNTLADKGCTVLMEIGPQPVLTAAAMRVWPDAAATPHGITSLRRDADAHRCFTEALAAVYTSGHGLHFTRNGSERKVDLPTYPFQRRPYWFLSTTATEADRTKNQVVIEPAPAEKPGLARDWLTATPPEGRLVRIMDLIRAEIADSLCASAGDIDPDAEFMSMGMDSLIAMELRRRLQSAFGIEFPASLFFAHPTTSALAEAMLGMWEECASDPDKRQKPIPRLDRDDHLPISHAQEQLWFLNQLLPSSSAYNVSARVDIHGAVDRNVLQRSLDAVVSRHEVLRETFHSVDGLPQAVLTTTSFDMPFQHVRSEAELVEAALAEARVPFDIRVGPLLRARLFGLDDERHALVLTLHHIVTDGWSFRILLRDLGSVYRALERGEPIPLPELPIQYADYAHWQREQLCGPEFDTHVGYWKRTLAGAPALELDTDRARPKTPTFRGRRLRFDLGEDRAAALRDVCRGENVTLSVPLLAALAALLSRYSGQDDVVIGTLTANRSRVKTEELIGLFVNALPVRIRLDGDPSAAEAIDRIRQSMVEALAHQDVPFDMIVNATAPERDANRNPLFSVQLVVQPASVTAELSELGLDVTEIDTQTAKRDLTLTFFDDARLSGHVEYATDLFDESRIERLIAHFQQIVDAMVADRSRRLCDLPLLTDADQAHYRRSQPPRLTTAQSIPELFEMTVDRVPDAIAVSAGDTSLTYRQLDHAANTLAWRLRELDVKSGDAIGLCVERTTSMAIGMLAILKAGAVYLPIDPSYPDDRTERMLADAGSVLVLDDGAVEDAATSRRDQARLENVVGAGDLAYIMFTSGSTGRPKGVAVSHGTVVEYAETLGSEVGIRADDIYLHTASISFSSSVRQMLLPLAAGAHVVIASGAERRDPYALLRRICAANVTIADLVPTMVRGITDAMVAAATDDHAAFRRNRLRLLLTASEPLRAGVVRAWREHMGGGTTWINMYGQTETAGIVSLHRVGDSEETHQSIVPIGRPRGNVALYVLDHLHRPVPPGISGELHISGTALAREYVGSPELTAQKFAPAPWDPDEILYASGDVVRLRDEGTIEFRGRTDRQVKIRGLRVEPAEIDRVLLEHPAVREAVTVVQKTSGEPDVLVSYFTVYDAPVAAGKLREHARLQLPEHMMPSAFVALDRIPQTPNGKVHQAALPRATVTRDTDVQFVEPRAGIEESLADIWRSALGVDQIGAADNFFALGGHSLLAAQVRARIHRVLGVELALEALFEEQTLADLARRIEREAGASAAGTPPLRPAPRVEPVPLSYAQELMWHAERDHPDCSANWINLSVRIDGPLDPRLLVTGVQDTVHRHELLRTVFRSTTSSVAAVILDSYTPDVPILDAPADKADCDHQGHDLAAQPAFHAEIHRMSEHHHVLRLRAHRILADGYSMRLLLSEVGGTVATALGINDFPTLDGELQYADFAIWERSWLVGDALRRRVDHFRKQFPDGDLPPALPTDRGRTTGSRREPAQLAFEFPSAAAEAARTLAVAEQASLYSVLLAAFAAALGKYSARDSVVIGAPVTRRSDPATQLIIGPFMNTLPVRIDLGADLPALVRDVKARVAGALSNQDAPWQYVLAALTAQHGVAARGVGEVAFLMDDPAPDEFAAGGYRLTRVPPDPIVARRELTVAMSSRRGQLAGTVTYDAGLFATQTIDSIVTNFIAAFQLSPALAEEIP